MGDVLVWKPKKHQQNITGRHLMNNNKAQQRGVDKHQGLEMYLK